MTRSRSTNPSSRRSPLRLLAVLVVLAGALTGGLVLLVAAFRESPPEPAPAFEPAVLPPLRSAAPAPPELARAGGVSAAIWVRTDTPPVAPVLLVQTAGVPAVEVRTAAQAFTHPLVVVWPDAALDPAELDAARSFAARGGHLVVVAPDAAARTVAATGGGVLDRLDLPDAADPAERAAAVRMVRMLWRQVPGGFTLADVPSGAPGGLVQLHDVRSTAAALAAPAIALDERARGVPATYAVQGSLLLSGDGPLAASQAQAALGEVRESGGELIAGGATGAPLQGLPFGTGRADPPGRPTLLGELRGGAAAVGGVTGLAPGSVRANGGVGDRVAAAEQAAGVTVDASVPAAAVGASLPYPAATEDGVRPVLRIPVSAAGSEPARPASGTNVVAAPTVPLAGRLRAEDALLGTFGQAGWVGGLGAYARFWEDRSSLAVDIQPARSGGATVGWFVRLAAPRATSDQALVAPFPVAFAATGSGRALHVAADGRTIPLPAFRTLLVQVAAREGR